MDRELFAITTFCSMHNIEHSFITSLSNEGLIQIEIDNNDEFIAADYLQDLEFYTRLHHELGINPEGIDAVRHLVNRIREMQNELNSLKNRLRLYEGDI